MGHVCVKFDFGMTQNTPPKTEKALKQQCGSDYAWDAFLEGARKQRFTRIKATKITL
jgi:hypothetical protein